MEQYQRFFTDLFGDTPAARISFLLLVGIVVGIPYMVRTWREINSLKHQLELHRAEIDLVNALYALRERMASSDHPDLLHETARARFEQAHAVLKVPTPPPAPAARDDLAITAKERIQVTSSLLLGVAVSVTAVATAPAIGLLIMLAVSAACIGTGRLRRGTMPKRAFYAGLTYVPLGILVIVIVWGLGSS